MSSIEQVKLETNVRQLRRQIRWLGSLFVVGCVVAAVLGVWRDPPALADDRPDSVLRVRGLIIEDDRGRERIVIGAPTPQVPGRKRKDASTAMVFLGEDGSDRMCIGFTPDPQQNGKVLKRIAPSVGLQINDPAGNERTGYGYLENGRVNLGIDWPNREAISIGVDDKEGSAIVMVWGEKDNTAERAGFFVGRDGTSLMKVSNELGFERFVLQTQGIETARFIVTDPKKRDFADVLPKLTAKP